MKIEGGKYLATTTGNKILILSDSTLNIQEVVFTVVSDTDSVTVGYSDSVVNYSTNKKHNKKSTTKCIEHWRTIGGVATKVFSASVPASAFSYPGEFNFTIDTLSSAIDVHMTVKGS